MDGQAVTVSNPLSIAEVNILVLKFWYFSIERRVKFMELSSKVHNPHFYMLDIFLSSFEQISNLRNNVLHTHAQLAVAIF